MARIKYAASGILAFFCILLGACSNGEDIKCRDASVSRFEGIVFVLSTGVGTFSKSTQCMVFCPRMEKTKICFVKLGINLRIILRCGLSEFRPLGK